MLQEYSAGLDRFDNPQIRAELAALGENVRSVTKENLVNRTHVVRELSGLRTNIIEVAQGDGPRVMGAFHNIDHAANVLEGRAGIRNIADDMLAFERALTVPSGAFFDADVYVNTGTKEIADSVKTAVSSYDLSDIRVWIRNAAQWIGFSDQRQARWVVKELPSSGNDLRKLHETFCAAMRPIQRSNGNAFQRI